MNPHVYDIFIVNTLKCYYSIINYVYDISCCLFSIKKTPYKTKKTKKQQ